jgi:hypothetical protein
MPRALYCRYKAVREVAVANDKNVHNSVFDVRICRDVARYDFTIVLIYTANLYK